MLSEVAERFRDPQGVADLHARARATKYCAHPIFLRTVTTIERRSTKISADDYNGRIARPCGSRIRSYCEACSYLYYGDSLQMVRTGLIGGKGIPETVAEHPKVFLTLTAPSFGRVHASSGVCHPALRRACRHGRSLRCGIEHRWEDPTVGVPLCHECYDGPGQILFNASISRLWDYTLIGLRRELSRGAGVSVRRGQELVRLEYLRVFELQRRGALHAHAIVRLDSWNNLTEEPTLSVEDLVGAIDRVIPHVKLKLALAKGNRVLTWGPEVDLQVVEPAFVDQISGYVSKYLSKDIGVDLAAEEESGGQSHLAYLASLAGDMAKDPIFLRQVSHRNARSLGFGGHLMSASKRFSLSRSALSAIRRDFAQMAREARGEAPDQAFDEEMTYRYDGRDWASTGDAWLVELERQQRLAAIKEGKEVIREGR